MMQQNRSILVSKETIANMNNRILWIDYLRSFIIILVVAHHSALAYTTFATFNKEVYILSTNPVVDSQRWIGTDILVFFNDIFFMSLMFLISGMFVIKSLNKKRRNAFIRERYNRLFIPFLAGVSLLMLIAHYPGYMLAHGEGKIGNYIFDFFFVEGWPVGPPWFIWVLFSFNLIFAAIYPSIKNHINKLSEIVSGLRNKPVTFVLTFIFVSWLLYTPLALLFGPFSWFSIGPFDAQKSRILLYFGYFVIGTVIGNIDPEKELFSDKSSLVKKWPLWIFLSLLAFSTLLFWNRLTFMIGLTNTSNVSGQLFYYLVYMSSCLLSCLAFLTLFKALVKTPKKWMETLGPISFSIYLVHYIFVIWSQYYLTKVEIAAPLKFVITFSISLGLSWITSILLKKWNPIKRFL
jgi:peptidoglycan/LPS O-acetylase OafA/YrhL